MQVNMQMDKLEGKSSVHALQQAQWRATARFLKVTVRGRGQHECKIYLNVAKYSHCDCCWKEDGVFDECWLLKGGLFVIQNNAEQPNPFISFVFFSASCLLPCFLPSPAFPLS